MGLRMVEVGRRCQARCKSVLVDERYRDRIRHRRETGRSSPKTPGLESEDSGSWPHAQEKDTADQSEHGRGGIVR
eukprot:COSAG06_NODE_2927_length_6081_cov_15.993313_9_plen_75_part_00